MEEVLVVVLQLFFEFFVQVLGGGLLDGASRGSGAKNDGCGILVLQVAVGGGLGWLSTLLVPQLFLPFLWLRLVNLVVSPVIAGGVSYWLATLGKPGKDAGGAFLHGFLFALMFGLARFAFAAR